MKTIPINSIVIKPNRQRREFDIEKLAELRDSLTSPKGMLHAIVLENDGVTLVAGERRMRAVKLAYAEGKTILYGGEPVPIDEIPYTTLGELPEHDLEEAQLEENLLRQDLSWQEKAAAYERLFALRAKQQGAPPTIGAIAEEVVGRDPTSHDRRTTREALLLAPHLNDREIASAPTQKEAIKRLEKKVRAEHNKKLAEILGNGINSSEHKLILGDAATELPIILDSQYSCIVVDPPYGIDADNFGSMATTDHEYADGADEANALVSVIAQESMRITLPQAHLYIFCDISNFHLWGNILRHAGWDVWPRPLIWNKGNGMLPRPEHGPRYTYECIIFANKGNKRVSAVCADVISIPAVQGKEHAAEKPVELYVDLLRRSTMPGDYVLDMCCGSGPIFPAANRLRLRAIGIEKSETHYMTASKRLEEK